MDPAQGGVERRADELTVAVYVHMLERRLAGEPVTPEQALRHVESTRGSVLEDLLRSAEAVVEASEETTSHEAPEAPAVVKVAVSRQDPAEPSPTPENPELPNASSSHEDPQIPAVSRVDPVNTTRVMVGGLPLGKQSQAVEALAVDRIVDGRYRLMQSIAAGGFSRVYMAERVSTHEAVILKFFAPPSEADRPACDEHFRAEVRALGRLDHPGVAHLLDSGVYEGLYYLVMECVLGETLRARMRRDPRLNLSCSLDVMVQACEALARAHERGVIHRDIKPENLMLEMEGEGSYRVRLVDFGLAMVELFEGDGVLPEAFAGTPRYMSPEQIRREVLTEASDIFSLGLVAYELLVGEHPFSRDTPEETKDAILVDEPTHPHVHAPTLPEGIVIALLGSLEKAPVDRPTSADQLGMLFGAQR
ncbi:MAG: serine/threonine-protein kinase [Phycisphaeraceae bacterium]